MEIIFDNSKPKYIQIFEQIASMINTAVLTGGEQLPSKRNLSLSLNVSLNTIINAYALLLEEGYIYSIEKKGYFVSAQPMVAVYSKKSTERIPEKENIQYDFTTQNVEKFSNTQWKKLIKESTEENNCGKTPLKGDLGLRQVISRHLLENRGITVSEENIVIGTGMEIFEQILSCTGIDSITLENPGYHKLAYIAANLDMRVCYLPLDSEGVTVPAEKTILYTTPFNQFPTGVKMSIARKKALIQWSIQTEGYIIEDDFDAEFRINSAPATVLFSLNPARVIFFSTFSTTLFPGLRISYAILPDKILNRFEEKYRHYSCGVTTTSQKVLKEFIRQGGYASHVNKMKKKYLKKRELCIRCLRQYNMVETDEHRNYLSLLIKLPITENDLEFTERLKKKGLKMQALATFDIAYNSSHIFILGYTAIPTEDIEAGIKMLMEEIKNEIKAP